MWPYVTTVVAQGGNVGRLKGLFGFYEVGLYEVLIDSQCATYGRSWSARPQCGEADMSNDRKLQCTAVDWGRSKTELF